jgi:MFS family permease
VTHTAIQHGAVEPAARRAAHWLMLIAALSLIGDCMLLVAAPWLALSETGSPLAAALVASAEGAAAIVSGLTVGPLIDRYGSRRFSIGCELAAGVTSGLIPLFFLVWGFALVPLLVLVVATSFVAAPGTPACQKLLYELTRLAGADTARINARYWLLQRGALVLGAPVAGVVIATTGAATAIAVDAATFVLGGVLLAAVLRGSLSNVGKGERPAEPVPVREYASELRQTLAFLFGDPVLRTILITGVCLNVFDSALVPVLLPVAVARSGGDAGSLGLLVELFAAGTLAGALAWAAVASRVPIRAAAVASLAVSGLAYAAMCAFEDALAPGLVLLGLAAGPLLPILLTVVQRVTPEEISGRVLGALFALVAAAIPLGRVVVGVGLSRWSVVEVFLAAGVAFAVASLALAMSPAMRDQRINRDRTQSA